MRRWEPRSTPLVGDALHGTCILLVTRRVETRRLFADIGNSRDCLIQYGETSSQAVWAAAIAVVLDLPRWETHNTLRQLAGTAAASHRPIAVIGPPDDTVETVLCLQLGADLYLPRDNSSALVAARLNAMVRRSHAIVHSTRISAGPLLVDVDRWEAHLRGQPLALTNTEFAILAVLAVAGGCTVSRAELRDRIWGADHHDLDPRSIDAHVYRLRRKLTIPRAILSVPGIGYRIGL